MQNDKRTIKNNSRIDLRKNKTHDKNAKTKGNGFNNGKKVNVNYQNNDKYFNGKESKSSDNSYQSNDNIKGGKKLKENLNKKKKKTLIVIMVFLSLFIIIGIIVLILIFTLKKRKPFRVQDLNSNIPDSTIPEPPVIIPETLTRKILNCKSTDNILVEGMNETIFLYKTNIYDITKIQSFGAGRENNINYSQKFSYTILLLKKCLNTYNEIGECQIQENEYPYLENRKNISLCLFNLTDDNIFLSIKCPKYFNQSQKLEIISDLNYLIQAKIDKENNTKFCGYNCFIEEIIYNNDDDLKFIYWKNKTISSKDGYRKKNELQTNDSIIEIDEKVTDFYEEAIKETNFELINLSKTFQDSNKEDNEDYYNEITLFNEEKLDFKISLKNRIENKNGNLKAYLILKINDLEKNIDYFSGFLKLDKIQEYKLKINEIKNLGNELIQNIINYYENIVDDILNNFNYINNEKYIKKLGEFFNSINKSDSQNFKNEIESSMNEILKLVNETSIDNNTFTDEININIRKYIEELVELINQISGNLQELKDLMNSQENTETIIANYYSNKTSTSFLDIIQNTNYIFTNYYKNESIYNEIQEMLKKVDFSEFESKINDKSSEFDIFFKHEQNDNIENNLNSLTNKIKSINQNIKDEFEKKIITEENGYFIPNIDIVNINNTFIEIINDLINAYSNLNNLDIDSIDKIFDQIMNDFKENITNILIFLEDEKNNKFPLEEDILNDNFFSSKEKQKIKNEIEELNNNIINEIKDTYNPYINNIQQEKLLKNKNELNSFIFEINALCSIDSLQELSKSFENTFKSYLNGIKNNLNLVFKNYNENLNDDNKIKEILCIDDKSQNIYKKMITKKINKKFEKIRSFKEHIEKNIINDLSKEFVDILHHIQLILFEIRKNRLNKYYEEIDDLSFINKNIDKINNISEQTIKLYFSKEIFINNFQNEINNIISEIKKINLSFINNFETSKTCSESDLYIQLNSGDTCINIFDELNEEEEFKLIYEDNEFKRFKNKLEEFYSLLNKSVTDYNTKIEEFPSSLSKKEEQDYSQGINLDFNPLENKINSILSEKFGEQLINNCYDYYKPLINERIENIMNNYLIRLNETYDFLKEKISENQNKFKNSFNEFTYMAAIYENIITQNITRNYFDNIIDSQKINFNYTITYYYNWFINLINSSLKNIKANLDKYGLNINIQEYKNTIDNKFNQLIEKITDSKKDSLLIDKQVYILNVPRTNFFKANSILSNTVLKARKFLEAKEGEIGSIDNNKYNTKNSLLSKFYSENSNFAKQIGDIGDIHKIIYPNPNSTAFDKEKFKEIIKNNFEFDKNEFIYELNLLLSNLKLENDYNFIKLKQNLTNIFEGEINIYFRSENKDGISDKINNFYNDSKLSDNQINEINENINDILNIIIQNIQKEKERIESEEKSYSNNYLKIKEQLEEYKNEVINKIENKIFEIVSEFKENMITKVYNNVEMNLNNYIHDVKEFSKRYNEQTLLNFSYNLGTTINNINEELINEYKETIKKQINYRNQIIDIINIEIIKEIIDKKIDNAYNNTLLPILKKYSSNSADIYDFDSTIKNEIKSNIESNLNNIENILTSFKNLNQINANDFPALNFTLISEKFSTTFNNSFEYFISESQEKENDMLIKLLNGFIKSTFVSSLNNTFILFGNDFLDRYMKYDDIFKIKQYKNYYMYYLTQTLLFNKILYSFKSNSHTLPKDLVKKIYNLSDIDGAIKNKRMEIIKEVNSTNKNIIEKIKEDIIQKYISDVDELLKSKINYSNNTKVKYFDEEDDYKIYKLINDSLDEHINKKYLQSMNDITNDLVNIIREQKKNLTQEIPEINEDTNEELNKINQIINNISLKIVDYKNNSFKINKDFSKEINKHYNNSIDKALKGLIDTFNSEKQNFKNKIDEAGPLEDLKKDTFIEMSNSNFSKINNILNNIINNITYYINEMKNRGLNDKLINNDAEVMLEKNNIKNNIFENILKISKKNRIFINTYELNKKIIDIINNFNSTMKDNIKSAEKNYKGEIKDYILSKLNNISNEFIDYYKKINNTLYNISKSLNTSINEIDKSLNNISIDEKIKINDIINIIKVIINNTNYNYSSINYEKELYLGDYMINFKIKEKKNVINNKNIFFNLNVIEDNIYEPNILATITNLISTIEIEIIHDPGNYKILITLDFNDNYNNLYKYKIDLQIFDIDSDGKISDNKCPDCTKQYNLEYEDNINLNL